MNPPDMYVVVAGPLTAPENPPGSKRIRDNQRAGASKRAWWRYYSARMRLGLEPCRWPGCGRRAQRFAHLTAWASGGRYTRQNLTLMCPPCDMEIGPRDVLGLPSLAAEEEALGRVLPEARYPDPRVSLADHVVALRLLDEVVR